jgi:hypothetical protein
MMGVKSYFSSKSSALFPQFEKSCRIYSQGSPVLPVEFDLVDG